MAGEREVTFANLVAVEALTALCRRGGEREGGEEGGVVVFCKAGFTGVLWSGVHRLGC